MVGDTLLTGAMGVEFRAPDGYDSYEWKIGNDESTFTDQFVNLVFLAPEPSIEIRLIVSRRNSSPCLSQSKEIDTLYKNLTIVSRREAAIIGTYRGTLQSNPQDTFDVWIAPNESLADPRVIQMFNLNEGCMPEHEGNAGDLGYDVYVQKSNDYIAGGCEGVIAWAFLDADRSSITISYQTFFPQDSDVFNGIKIN